MNVHSISNGLVILHLTPHACGLMAIICGLATSQVISEHTEDLECFAEAVTSLFKACTIASYGQTHLPPTDLAALAADLQDYDVQI